MRKSIIIACFFLSLIGFNGYAIEPDSLAHMLEYQILFYPQEKVYMSTDKNIYSAGDTIRFRAFLVDALKLSQKRDGSKYVHVELKDPFGESVRKIKVKENEDSIFAGIIPLPEEMAEGTYTLGAYTLFMKNQGSDYIFRKPLPIKSQLARKYRLDTSFDGDVLTSSLSERFGNKPVKALSVELSSKDGVLRENIRNRSNFNFSLNSKVLKEDVLKVRYDRYEKFIKIPKDTSGVSITFHPEGGYIVPGTVNKIAFKTLGSNGLSKEVKGVVFDSKGDSICEFASSHKGMGSFLMQPETGETYTTRIGDRSFNLPETNTKATALSIDVEGNDSITIKINGVFKPGYVLIADNCGIVTYARKLENPRLNIARESVGSGIIQFYLVDPKNNIISSRLIFNRKGYIYADEVSSIPKGDYAVTSRKTIADSINSQSIVSELMLQSDLKGHIEEPDYYFIAPDSIKDIHLDNLLLTQGWKRYDIQKALKGKYGEPEEPMEIGGELTGTVFSRWKRKPLEGAVVNAIAPEINYVGVAQTDSSGKFALNGVDWPEGTLFIVQVFNKNGNREHNYEVDRDVSLPVENLPEYIDGEVTEPAFFDNGAIWLQELEVTAQKSDEELRQDMYRALGVRTVTSEDIEQNNITSYEEAIRKIPGLMIQNGNLINIGAKGSLRGEGGFVELWVDGTKWTPIQETSSSSGSVFNTFQEFSDAYPINIMESIQYFRSSIAMVISQSAALGAGALVMKTKDGSKLSSWDHDLFIKQVTPLGYQKEAEAYEPHFTYDPTQESPTVTSYWYPQVSNVEELPSVHNSYIVIEGITDKGLPYFGTIKPFKQETE